MTQEKFAKHRVVINPDASGERPYFQFQVSTDDGETWFSLYTKEPVELKSGKGVPCVVKATFSLFNFDEGVYGAIEIGEFSST